MKPFYGAVFSLLLGFLPRLCIAEQFQTQHLAQWQPSADIASAFLLTLNGKTQWQKQADTQLPPASLTKLMTALVLIDNPKLDDWVSVSKNATQQDGTKLRLKSKEQFRAAYLIGAMLIRSANDACMALVEWDADNEAAFVYKMNAKVAAMGLKNTHFTNPCGFDNPKHLSTAYDLLKIAQAANAQPKIKVWTDMLDLTLQEKNGKTYKVVTSNMLLGRVAGVDGLKTGFTQKAGKCLIAHGHRNGSEVYLVMLNAPNRWWDADGLMSRALNETKQ